MASLKFKDGFYPDEIYTSRLVLKRLSADTVPFDKFYDFMLSDGVSKAFENFVYDTPSTRKETEEYIEERTKENVKGNDCFYIIQSSEENELFGLIAVKDIEAEAVAELGFWISEAFWGNGYAPEASTALIEMLREMPQFDTVEFKTRDSNEKAQRAIEKLIEPFDGDYVGTIDTTLGDVASFSDSDKKISESVYEISV